MPWPRSNRTSHRDEGALSAPRSMKEVGSTHAAIGVTSARTPLPSRATRPRWNRFLLIPSRRQNSEAAMPLAAWRENSSRHVASLRRIRLVFFIAPVSSTITGRDYSQWTGLRKCVAALPVTLARHEWHSLAGAYGVGWLEVVRDGAAVCAFGAGASCERSQENRTSLGSRGVKPYDFPTPELIVRTRECKYLMDWRARRDSNPRPPGS